MALSFPREFPFDGCFTEDCEFTLAPQQSQSLTGGGSPDVADLADGLHHGRWRTTLLDRKDYAIWDAWLTSLRGGLRLFKGRPNRHRWPMTYPRGFAGLTVSSEPFTGIGNLSTIGAGRDTITINQVPNGFVLLPGDWFSIPVGSRQHIHMVTEGGTAAGNAVSISCEPIIMPGVTTTTAVRLDTPYCDMVLMGPPERKRWAGGGGTIAFAGRQVLI